MRGLVAAAALLALLSSPSLTLAQDGGPHGGGPGYDQSPQSDHGQAPGPRGNDRHPGNDRHSGNDQGRGNAGRGHGNSHMDGRFGDSDRHAIADYYGPDMRAGRCPPGLAKKGNGCLPPGQARKWQMGHPLPNGLVRYPLPPELLGRLAPPPAGYEYTRVAGDVLMIATGTSMVVDAIRDIGR